MATKTTRTEARRTAPAAVAAPVSTRYASSSPYSFEALIRFFADNAGLIFIALAVFILGFLVGSLWTENMLLKKGIGAGAGAAGGGVPTGQVPPAPEASPIPLSDEDWKAVQEKPAGVIGNKNAKLTIVEFTDYQCPFCARHFTDTYPQLKKEYIDTGKVKVILKDQPLSFHANARISAMAARCGGDQGKFEAMHDILFKNQTEWVNLGKDAAITKFGDYASQIGANATALKNCVSTEKYGQAVDDDAALGSRVGASGTPTFFIEKEILVGAMPYASFKAILDKNL